MDSITALRAIRRGWYLVVLGIVAAIGITFVMQSSVEPFYEITSTYIVSPVQDPTDPGMVQESIRTLDDARSRAIVATFAEVLDSGGIHAEAAGLVGIDVGLVAAYDFSSAVLPEANVVELTVRGPQATAAVLLSGAVGDLAAERFSDLYQIYDIVLLDSPVTPTSPANTPLGQMLALAAALGLLAGSALALLWGAPQIRKVQQRQRRLLSYVVSEGPTTVTHLRSREDERAAGSG